MTDRRIWAERSLGERAAKTQAGGWQGLRGLVIGAPRRGKGGLSDGDTPPGGMTRLPTIERDVSDIRVRPIARRWPLLAVPLVLLGAAGPAVAQPPPARVQAGSAALGQPGTLAQELAAARRAGLPTRPGDMTMATPSPSRNAATYYVRLSTLYERLRGTPPLEQAESLAGRTQMSPSDLQAARGALRRYAEVGKLVHQAVACDRCAFRRDWSQGAAMRVPEIAAERFAVRWLALEASVQHAEGKTVQAVETRALGFRVARHAASDMMLLGGLCARSCEGMTVSGLRSLLYASRGDPRVVRAVRRALAGSPPGADLARLLRGEVVTALVSVQQVRLGGPGTLEQLAGLTGGVSTPPARQLPRPRSWDALMDANAAYVLWYYRHLAASAKLPFPRQRVLVDGLQADLDRHLDARDLQTSIAAIVMPHFPNYVAQQARSRADLACLRAGVALLAYRGAHGAFPRSLSQAASPPLTDPFDGKPLRYRLEAGGFVLYSVGRGLRFDGGKPTAKPLPAESLFRWPKPPYLP